MDVVITAALAPSPPSLVPSRAGSPPEAGGAGGALQPVWWDPVWVSGDPRASWRGLTVSRLPFLVGRPPCCFYLVGTPAESSLAPIPVSEAPAHVPCLAHAGSPGGRGRPRQSRPGCRSSGSLCRDRLSCRWKRGRGLLFFCRKPCLSRVVAVPGG